MQRTLKYFGYLIFIILVTISLYLMNLFSKKPYSLDHFLAKELIVGVFDSPEYMTYLGIFDDFSPILGHNQKLSISSLEDDEKNYV